MAELRGMPPGRAGRMWARQRRATAQAAAALLDRQLQALRAARGGLIERAVAADTAWRRDCAEAQQWLARAALLGGERSIRLAAAPLPARVAVEWASTMGARHPVVRRVDVAEPDPGPAVSSALHLAALAYAAAVRSAAENASASAALAVVDEHIRVTARRLRAVDDRWLPRLDEALTDVSRRLEETERAETARLRWAVARRTGRAFEEGERP